MTFSLCNAPATIYRCMTAIFVDYVEEIIEVCMDDFSIYDTSFNNCLHNIDNVLQRCQDTSLVLNWKNVTSW
jgi:hypothetical protein